VAKARFRSVFFGVGGKQMFQLALIVSLTVFQAFAVEPPLARDVEALRSSLALKDSARPTLTLRLADILFDHSVELAGSHTLSEAEKSALTGYRRRALDLYQEALSGTSFHPGAQGALAVKIQFQMARLHQELGATEAALKAWKVLVKQEEIKDIRREAALRLAEYYEKQKTAAAFREADSYYRLSIELCGQGDVCAYGHYRHAWALREAGQLSAAIDEMQVALFDSKGQVRDEALRDLLVFLSAEKTDGERALLLVEQLAAKTGRPTLFEDLAEAFYSAGNRQAGTRVLSHVNSRTPELSHQVRLMEEYYGLRQWEKFRSYLSQAGQNPLPQGGVDSKTDKILRRLSVQLDGERASNSQLADDFKSVVLLYMKLFPKNPDQFKMVEGWLAAEADSEARSRKIDEWLSGPDLGLSVEQQTKLREIRLAIAVKAKNSPVIELESGKLASIVKEPARVREYRYIQAVSMKEQGRSAEALSSLAGWALPNTKPQDNWSFRGGLLQVDILVEQKNYAELVRVTGEWLASPEVQQAAKAAKDKKLWDDGLKSLAELKDESVFEVAAQGGETPAALEVFQRFCLAGRFLPKSCDNGRVLAVKLKDQKAVLTLLKAMDRKSELAAEYEAAGFFADSAEIQEKALKSEPDDKALLKLSLLYELANRFTDRNRLVEMLLKRIRERKSMGENEEIVFATLRDAKMLGASSLDLPWSEANRLRIANALELEGKGTERTKKELLASTKAAGVAWSRHVLAEIARLDAAQRKISFYGKKGQEKFKARLALIAQLDSGVEKYFAGADLNTRSRMAILLRKSYADFSEEILNSPTPEGLSPEVLAEVKASLSSMAEPFQKKKIDYENLAREQLAQISAVSEKAALEALLVDPDVNQVVRVEAPAVASLSPAPEENYKTAVSKLHEDPASTSALAEIKSFYESQGKSRLASYFQGRLLQLGAVQGEKP
jgi:hypothetical protein